MYDLSKPDYEKVVSVEALCTDCIVPRYEKLDLDRNYTVIMPRFLCEKGFPILIANLGKNFVNLRGRCIQIVRDFATSKLSPKFSRSLHTQGIFYTFLDPLEYKSILAKSLLEESVKILTLTLLHLPSRYVSRSAFKPAHTDRSTTTSTSCFYSILKSPTVTTVITLQVKKNRQPPSREKPYLY